MEIAPKLTEALSAAAAAAARELGISGEPVQQDHGWSAPASARGLVAPLPSPAAGELAIIVDSTGEIDDAVLSRALTACVDEVRTALSLPTTELQLSDAAPGSYAVVVSVGDGTSTVAVGYSPTATTTKSRPGDAMRRLHDVEMVVTAELGRAKLTVREILAMVPGNVVELDRVAGAPIDLLVNGKLVARGEVVVIDEEFGVRVTEVVGSEE